MFLHDYHYYYFSYFIYCGAIDDSHVWVELNFGTIFDQKFYDVLFISFCENENSELAALRLRCAVSAVMLDVACKPRRPPRRSLLRWRVFRKYGWRNRPKWSVCLIYPSTHHSLPDGWQTLMRSLNGSKYLHHKGGLYYYVIIKSKACKTLFSLTEVTWKEENLILRLNWN